MAQEQHDFRKDWNKIKESLMAMSQEAKVLARKGEEELVKFSKKSKLHIDVTSLGLKKEKLFYRIGKEYVKTRKADQPSDKMVQMLEELAGIEKQERQLKRKMKSSKAKQV